MNVLKRILLFVVCFVVIASVAFAVTGAIIGAIAARNAGDASDLSEIGGSAARTFALRYGLFIWLGSFVISAGIAFRWIGAITAGAVSALVCFFAGGAAPLPKPQAQNAPASATASPESSGSNPAQQRAVQLYPELGVTNSPLNQEFVRRFRKYQVEDKHYFDNPEWPTALAKESKDALIHK